MNGLYRMFLGDARPNHSGDEWVFQDVDTIQEIVIPASRIALKVHQVGVACDSRNYTCMFTCTCALHVEEEIRNSTALCSSSVLHLSLSLSLSPPPPPLPPSHSPSSPGTYRITLHSQKSMRVHMVCMRPFKM